MMNLCLMGLGIGLKENKDSIMYRNNNFGYSHSIIKLEHILFLAVFVIVFSLIALVFSALLQLGLSDLANGIVQVIFGLLVKVPWWIWLVTGAMGVLFLIFAEGKGE